MSIERAKSSDLVCLGKFATHSPAVTTGDFGEIYWGCAVCGKKIGTRRARHGYNGDNFAD